MASFGERVTSPVRTDAHASSSAVLDVDQLAISVGRRKRHTVVEGMSFHINQGETLALVGESGAGKSLTAMAIAGLLPPETAHIAAGTIRLQGKLITGLGERSLRHIRGRLIGTIFQEPMKCLNPIMKIKAQMFEAIRSPTRITKKEKTARVLQALENVQISNPEMRLNQFPYELSGGIRQRIMIAMALLMKPALLIADEPTTALDVTVQAEILQLIKSLQAEMNTALLLITHDMGVVSETSDRVIVMRDGKCVEEGPAKQVLTQPTAAYSRALIAAVPQISDSIGKGLPPDESTVLSVDQLSVKFGVRGGLLNRVVRYAPILKSVSFELRRGETLGIVGESGCGKSTTARAIMRLVPYTGTVTLKGPDHAQGNTHDSRRDIQMIFQDPYASLDPKMTVGNLVREPLDVYAVGTRAEREEWVVYLFERVGLSVDMIRRYPYQLSGGQRQRVCLARAVALKPAVIIADECTSALDVSVQAKVLELLQELQSEFQLACIFISHNMAVIQNISNRVAVMYAGQIIEYGGSRDIFFDARHPYTQRLLDAVPRIDGGRILAGTPAVTDGVASLGHGVSPGSLDDVGNGHFVAY